MGQAIFKYNKKKQKMKHLSNVTSSSPSHDKHWNNVNLISPVTPKLFPQNSLLKAIYFMWLATSNKEYTYSP